MILSQQQALVTSRYLSNGAGGRTILQARNPDIQRKCAVCRLEVVVIARNRHLRLWSEIFDSEQVLRKGKGRRLGERKEGRAVTNKRTTQVSSTSLGKPDCRLLPSYFRA